MYILTFICREPWLFILRIWAHLYSRFFWISKVRKSLQRCTHYCQLIVTRKQAICRLFSGGHVFLLALWLVPIHEQAVNCACVSNFMGDLILFITNQQLIYSCNLCVCLSSNHETVGQAKTPSYVLPLESLVKDVSDTKFLFLKNYIK